MKQFARSLFALGAAILAGGALIWSDTKIAQQFLWPNTAALAVIDQTSSSPLPSPPSGHPSPIYQTP